MYKHQGEFRQENQKNSKLFMNTWLAGMTAKMIVLLSFKKVVIKEFTSLITLAFWPAIDDANCNAVMLTEIWIFNEMSDLLWDKWFIMRWFGCYKMSDLL